MKFPKLYYWIDEGRAFPPFFGAARFNYQTCQYLALPIPCNFFVGWWDHLCFFLRKGHYLRCPRCAQSIFLEKKVLELEERNRKLHSILSKTSSHPL